MKFIILLLCITVSSCTAHKDVNILDKIEEAKNNLNLFKNQQRGLNLDVKEDIAKKTNLPKIDLTNLSGQRGIDLDHDTFEDILKITNLPKVDLTNLPVGEDVLKHLPNGIDAERVKEMVEILKKQGGPELENTVGFVKNLPNDIKVQAKNALDSAQSLVQDTMDNSKSTTVEKVEKVPVPVMIEKEGYPSQTHAVTTSDGYILELHRIPHGKNGKKNNKVVLLQHGLLGASSDWVLFGPSHGLAYILADQGYDVWMGNFRGNSYSRKHKTLDPVKDMLRFWGFCWHEMGMEDLPAMIDYILEKTNQKSIYYVGHGQGTTAFFVMASMKPEYNKKIKAQISLAPMGYMGNLFSPLLRLLATETVETQALWQLMGNFEFSPNSGLLDTVTDTVCTVNVGKVLCKNSMFVIAGFSPKQMNTSYLPQIMAHYPAGGSTRQVLHYVQEINTR